MTAETAPADVRPADPAAHATQLLRGLLRHPVRIIVAAQAVWMWWAMSQGWFLQADLSNLAEAVGRRPGWGYISGQIGGHFAPVARLVYWLFDELSPLDYGLAVALRVGCQMISTYLLYRLLTKLVRSDLLVAVIVVIYAFNPLLMAGTAMFTPGITVGIGQVFTLLALHAHVRREQTGERKPAIVAGLMLGLAVACSEQWALAFLAFPLLSLVHFYGGPLGDRLRRLVRNWRTWVLLAVPSLIVGIGVLAYAEPVGAASPSLYASYRLLRNSWIYSIGPSWIGGPLQWYGGPTTYISTASPSDLVVVLGQVAVALTVIVGVQLRGRGSLAGWLPAIGFWVTSMLLVGYRGFGVLSDMIAVTPRYLAAIMPFFALSAALALGRGGVAPIHPADQEQPGEPAPIVLRGPWLTRQNAPVVAIAAGVAAVLVTSVVSGVRFAHNFAALPAERYVTNLANTARLYGPKVNIYDAAVPRWLISPVEPHHQVSDLLRLSRVTFTVEAPGSTPMMAASDGRLVRSVFIPGSALIGTPPCGTLVRGAGTFSFLLNHRVLPARWYLHLAGYQYKPSTVQVDLVNASGGIITPLQGSTLHLSQLAAVTLRLPFSAPVALRVRSADPHTALCLSSVLVGAPFPVTGP